jgi:DNA-binding NarL/FixJ family response regulator
MLKILIVDDHALFRDGLKLLLQSRAATTVVGEAESGPQAARLAGELRPDIVILDIAMPGGNGIDALPHILAASPMSKVIALSTYDEERMVRDVLEAGAKGYILKSSAFVELDAAIGQVSAGHIFLSPALNDGILASFLASEGSGSAERKGTLATLTARERSVLRLLCEEKPPKAVAAELGISRKTVDIHKRNIMAKLGVSNDLALFKIAIASGLLPGQNPKFID